MTVASRPPRPETVRAVSVPGRLTHHLELYVTADIDDEVLDWLREAWMAAA